MWKPKDFFISKIFWKTVHDVKKTARAPIFLAMTVFYMNRGALES